MKKNISLSILLLVLSFFVYIAYERKKVKNIDDIKYISKLDERAIFKWVVHYDNIHLGCEKKGTNHLLFIFKKSTTNSEPFIAEKYPISSSAFLANVKNFNTLEYLSVVDNTNNEKKWKIDRNQFYQFFYFDQFDQSNKKDKVKTATLYRGGRATAPKGYYVAFSDSEKIYSVEEWVIKALEKKPEELRNKKVFNIEPEDLFSVEIGLDFKIKQVGKHWSINGSKTSEVNTRRVDTLVQNIAFLKAKKVFSTNIPFDDIKKKITISYKKKNETNQTIWFYLGLEKEKYYCKLPNQKETYELEKYYVSIITNPIYYYLNQK